MQVPGTRQAARLKEVQALKRDQEFPVGAYVGRRSYREIFHDKYDPKFIKAILSLDYSSGGRRYHYERAPLSVCETFGLDYDLAKCRKIVQVEILPALCKARLIGKPPPTEPSPDDPDVYNNWVVRFTHWYDSAYDPIVIDKKPEKFADVIRELPFYKRYLENVQRLEASGLATKKVDQRRRSGSSSGRKKSTAAAKQQEEEEEGEERESGAAADAASPDTRAPSLPGSSASSVVEEAPGAWPEDDFLSVASSTHEEEEEAEQAAMTGDQEGGEGGSRTEHEADGKEGQGAGQEAPPAQQQQQQQPPPPQQQPQQQPQPPSVPQPQPPQPPQQPQQQPQPPSEPSNGPAAPPPAVKREAQEATDPAPPATAEGGGGAAAGPKPDQQPSQTKAGAASEATQGDALCLGQRIKRVRNEVCGREGVGKDVRKTARRALDESPLQASVLTLLDEAFEDEHPDQPEKAAKMAADLLLLWAKQGSL